jgi:small subunit ribosomal protein S2
MTENNSGPAELAGQNKSQSPVKDYFSGLDFSKMKVEIEDMFKSGVHFGHHKSRKNPKMDEYIFATKNGVNIINLEQAKEKLKEALAFIKKVVSEGQEVLFVGTKKQTKRLVESAAKACDMPYVSERWLGGTFTNFSVISNRTRYLRDGIDKNKKGEYEKYTKFERGKKMEELERLDRKMGGIKNMIKFPGAVFAVSAHDDSLAIKEARAKNIPVIALIDTNSDPFEVDYPIPANDDAVSSLRLILGYICKAVLEGKEEKEKKAIPPEAEKTVQK